MVSVIFKGLYKQLHRLGETKFWAFDGDSGTIADIGVPPGSAWRNTYPDLAESLGETALFVQEVSGYGDVVLFGVSGDGQISALTPRNHAVQSLSLRQDGTAALAIEPDYSAGEGTAVWISDGSQDGTWKWFDISLLQSVNRKAYGFFDISTLDDRIVVPTLMNTRQGGYDIFVTDGTPEGTEALLPKGVRIGTDGYDPILAQTGAGDTARLYFVAKDAVHGQELWVSDGTALGTHMVADLNPGRSSAIGVSKLLIPYEDKLIFAAKTATTGMELWITDGTEAGTTLLADTARGVASGMKTAGVTSAGAVWDNWAEINGEIWFSDDRSRLWRTDGTATGTELLLGAQSVLADNGGTRPLRYGDTRVDFHQFTGESGDGGDLLLYAGADVTLTRGGAIRAYQPYNLWITDGTKNGTVQLTFETSEGGSANSDDGIGFVDYVGQAGTYMFFVAASPRDAEESALWVTNGDPGGTFVVTSTGTAAEYFDVALTSDGAGAAVLVGDPSETPLFRNIDPTARGDGILWTRGGELRAGAGDDRLQGGRRADAFFGEAGDDDLAGRGGRDRLDGGEGNDRLTGGQGADIFVFSPGRNVVTDFNLDLAREKIDLSGAEGIRNWRDLARNHLQQDGDDVTITDAAGAVMRLENVALADLDRADFLF